MLRLHLESDICADFPAIRHENIYLETGLFWPWPLNSRGSRHRFHRCFTALSLIFWFMGDVSSDTASVCARDVLPPFSIKVQVVTMVWHSLSACGFCGPGPEQLGRIGCHIQPPTKERRGRRRGALPTFPYTQNLCDRVLSTTESAHLGT